MSIFHVFLRLASITTLLAALQGCVAYTVASTTADVVGTGISTTAKVIGGAAELAVDAVSPSDDEEKKLEALERICENNPDYHECRALAD